MPSSSSSPGQSQHTESTNPYEPLTDASTPPPRPHNLTRKIFHLPDDEENSSSRPSNGRRCSNRSTTHSDGGQSLSAALENDMENKKTNGSVAPRSGPPLRPVGGSEKLGTFAGVFVPTTLNVLSILMFLRFGFLLGQGGVLGMMGMLVASYLINLVTTLSISAIATNGTVRGGGAYYLISRSLGPEFGGSIGVVLYLGFVLNTGMNAVGLIDCLSQNFGATAGNWYTWLPDEFWWRYLFASVVLAICTAICLAGSSIFARASNGLLAVLMVATLSIPFTALLKSPFESRRLGIEYTGLSAETFRGNLFPGLTKGADGSQLKGRENFQDLFGILFPATGGIFAGASMSGDLKHPSKAIPKGTLAGLALTFLTYTLVILAMAATITRASFYRNVNVIQDTNLSAVLILLGELATTLFSTLMGVIGSAKLLQALARDNLLPGLSIFGQGTAKGDEPTYGILITHIVTQITMLSDINQIASFVTMTYLMTFLVTNLACFLLKISSAPNFRPSFHYFNWQTAAAGTVISGAMMFFVDGFYATGCVGILVIIFLLIHYTTPPKSWGDVSQSLIYHQVRKYLLRLRQEHVKFWRPQILLFVNDPRRQYKLIQFCNSMKKGALYILAHVIVTDDFGASVPEARRQQAAWTKYIDFSKIKAFVNITISPAVEWGCRNLVLSSGLGGMRPNIAVLGMYNFSDSKASKSSTRIPQSPTQNQIEESSPEALRSRTNTMRSRRLSTEVRMDGLLPTDTCKIEATMSASSYVTILEDLLFKLQINVTVAKGFRDLEIPDPHGENTKKYVDLWPIQMCAEIPGADESNPNLLTTNFDTYTLILQLGCILDTVPSWQKAYKLRVAVFVEYESDVEEERGRVKALLDNLRMQAEVLVFWLASGDIKSYQVIVNGQASIEDIETERMVEEVLADEEWWQEIQKIRGKGPEVGEAEQLADVEGLLSSPMWPGTSFQQGARDERAGRFEGLKKLLRKRQRRNTMSGYVSRLGVSMGMRTHRLHPEMIRDHASHGSASEDYDSSESSDDEHFMDDHSPRRHTPQKSHSHIHISRAGDSDMAVISGDESDPRIQPRRSVPDITEHTNRMRGIKPAKSKSPPPSSPTPGLSTSTSPQKRQLRPKMPTPHQSTRGKFSSKPVPITTVAADENAPGPSIMFADTPSPAKPSAAAPPSSSASSSAPQRSSPSIYNRGLQPPDPPSPAASPSSRPTTPPSRRSGAATGFPSPQAVPLSFNDLPCRAQHLILNELMRAHSRDTAVLFTTLPSPVQGTCRSEADSARYLGDLEVLCEGLPPCALVHSNSMTVTMNL